MRSRPWSPWRRSPSGGWVVPLLVAAAAVALFLGWFDRAQPPLIGRAQAVDGDTLRLRQERIRLIHLDAPEIDQTCTDAARGAWPCGTKARSFLADLLRSDDTVCVRSGHDRYGRILAACSIAGRDVGAQLVDAGWAVADFGYGVEEANAQAGGRGIWSGSFVTPDEWRRTHGDASPGIWAWIRSWFQ